MIGLKKKQFRRLKDDLLFLLTKKDRSDPAGNLLEEFGESLMGDKITYPIIGEYLGISYTIIEKAYTHQWARQSSREFDVDLIIDGISLPRYPRNFVASKLVMGAFSNLMYVSMWVEPLDVENRRTNEFMCRPGFLEMFPDEDVVHPGYKNRGSDYMKEKDKATEIARKVIGRYCEKREPFQKVLDIIEREYPTTDAEWHSISNESRRLLINII